MKYTLLVTQDCNLRCKYCYIGKRQATMPLSVAGKIVNFIYSHTPAEEKKFIGFFGGEPLLEFQLIQSITDLIENHRSFDSSDVEISVVTNGTVFSDEIADFINEHKVVFVVSCDGSPFVQDLFRCFPDGNGASSIVENTIRKAGASLPLVMVNAVYRPQTLRYLPRTIEYLSSLGVKHIYLNPDFSAPWKKEEIDLLPEVYREIADQYANFYLKGKPHYISLIDSKIAIILRGGYEPLERCRMGRGEFAFTPEGTIYPCERLVGSGKNKHCIGNINEGLEEERMSCHMAPSRTINSECLSCGLNDYCMNWCGCSNFFSSGYYNRVSAFLCASERAAIQTSFDVLQELEKELGPTFADHLAGLPSANTGIKTNIRRSHEEAPPPALSISARS